MSEYDDLAIHLGIGGFNIPDAASLIAKSLYYDGEIELEEFNDDDLEYSIFCLKLEKALEKYIEKYSKVLLEAIEKKSLATVFIRRKLDESIIPSETLISSETLIKWLEERNINLGDVYYTDYREYENTLIEKMMDLASKERMRMTNPEEYDKYRKKLSEDPANYFGSITDLQKELNEYKTQSKEKPFHTKEKQSLLKLFIGMAISNYGYDSILNGETKASEILSDIIINSGIQIDEDTVRKFLKKAIELVPVIEKV